LEELAHQILKGADHGGHKIQTGLVPTPCPRAVSIVVGPGRSGSSEISWLNSTQIASMVMSMIAAMIMVSMETAN
jgi:hypothetical protein